MTGWFHEFGGVLRRLPANFREWRKDVWRDVVTEPKVGYVGAWVILAFVALVVLLSLAFVNAPEFIPEICESSPDPCPAEKKFEISSFWGWFTLAAVSILALVMGWQPIAQREGARFYTALAAIVLVAAALVSGSAVGLLAYQSWPNMAKVDFPGIDEALIAKQSSAAGTFVWFSGPTMRIGVAVIVGMIAALLLPLAIRTLWRWTVEAIRFTRSVFRRSPDWIRQPAIFMSRCIVFFLRFPARLFSAIDVLLVRGLAVAAGANLRSIWLRYSAVFVWLGVCGVLAYFASPLGPPAAILGIAIIISMVRRWLWIEQDRVQFVVRRGKKLDEAQRIGFGQDLRDEALTVIVALFVFIPLALRQGEFLGSLFSFTDDHGPPSLLEWMGYFGAELAKAVPLVDWSEVFEVQNGSDIEPLSDAGFVAVFALRAMLDLLLIASVLQAMQITAQLNEQAKAFESGVLDILDPFEERRRFDRFGRELLVSTYLATPELPRVAELATLDRYSLERLKTIALGTNRTDAIQRDPVGLRFAASVLAARGGIAPLLERVKNPTTDPETLAFIAMLVAEGAKDPESREALRNAISSDDRLLRVDMMQRVGALSVARLYLALSLEGSRPGLQRRAMQLAKKMQMGADREAVITLGYALTRMTGLSRELVANEFLEPQREAVMTGCAFADPERPGSLVRFKAGQSFVMGSVEEKGAKDERPHRRIEFERGFAMSRFPVTFEEFDAYTSSMNGAPRAFDANFGRGQRPVMNVQWLHADNFIAWLNVQCGLTSRVDRWRLPTEAEWEFACRAGSQEDFCFGSDRRQLQEFAWFASNSRAQTHPVGQKRPNAFGLYDMHGNVLEWCLDAYAPYDPERTDGSEHLPDTRAHMRVARGGAWTDTADNVRSASRRRQVWNVRQSFLGFRLARTLP